MRQVFGFVIVAGLLVGCTPNGEEKAPETGDLSKYVLAAEPSGARSVKAVRKSAQDGDKVVVVGKVGGHAKPLTDERAIFLIADEALPVTVGCSTPWDFCEVPREERKEAILTVRVVDDKGKTVAKGARELFGLEELSVVVVRGTVRRDDKGNVTILASGVHARTQ